MTFDYRRVAEIYVPDTREFGTGYVLCDGCLLTAFHVIDGCGEAGINFRTLGQYEEDPENWVTTSNLIWHKQAFDIAIFQYTCEPHDFPAFPWIKSLNSNTTVVCKAQGFPRFRETEDSKTKEIIFDPYLAQGNIIPQINPKKKAELLIDISGSAPPDMTYWKGLSGAALFSEDGYLLGVVTQGPKALKGAQLEAIALETVIRDKPDLNACLNEEFKQALYCHWVSSPEMKEIYDLELEFTALTLKQANHQIAGAQLNADLARKELSLKQQRKSSQSLSDYTDPPKKQLYDLLCNIENLRPRTFGKALSLASDRPAIKIELQNLDIRESYAVLSVVNDDYQSLATVLAHIYSDLQQPDSQLQELLGPLRDLAQSICDLDITQLSQENPSPPITDQPNDNGGCWLIKIDDKSGPKDQEKSYAVTAWLVKNRQNYEQQIDEHGKAKQNLEDFSQKVVDTEIFDVNAKDPETHGIAFKEGLSNILTPLWDDPNLAIEQFKPEVVFFIPKPLLSIDFESIQLGINILGRELPVSISILDRYKETPRFSRSRNYWIERWNVLMQHTDDPIGSHVEIFEQHMSQPNPSLDLTCPVELRGWLLEQDDLREADRQVVGLGFYSPYVGFQEVLDNLILNGLSIMIWPQSPLDESATQALESALQVVPRLIGTAIKRYRIHHLRNYGPLALWIDNPYLPPPDPDLLKRS